jgi:hypothetical protein
MTIPFRGRAFAVCSACVLLVTLFVATPAAAQGVLPFGQNAVPEEFRPLMQKPFGISFMSLNVGETLNVSNLTLALGGQRLPPGAVSLDTVTHSTHIAGVSADAWLLPFVDVHGMLAHTWGTASDINPTVAPGILPPGIAIPSSQDYGGTSYGGGVTLAIGYKRMFASYDITYSSTAVDLLDDRVTALSQSIRAGVKLGSGKVRTALYGGAMHESIRSTLSGTGLIPNLNPAFSLDLAPQEPWNALAGAAIELTPRFVIIAEGGFGNRMQFLIGPGVRF